MNQRIGHIGLTNKKNEQDGQDTPDKLQRKAQTGRKEQLIKLSRISHPRPFKKVVTESTFTVFPNNFDEGDTSLSELSHVACDPVGMAWSIDNTTVFLSDAHSRNVTKCSYSMEYIRGVQKEMDATNCSTLVHLPIYFQHVILV